MLVPVGSTRVIEFVPEEPGDWAMHCHMTHHVMTQMGHGLPPMVGVDTQALDRRMSRVVPGYMTHGHDRHGRHGRDGDADPAATACRCAAAPGPFGYIDMGGMFTILKVRDNPEAADPAGWYAHPAGSVAGPADPERMRADGIDADASAIKKPA